MSRGLATAFKDALGSSVIFPALFVEFQFDESTTRFWTGETNISADLGDGSVTWTGGGLLGSIDTSGESEDVKARRTVYTLNGVDQAYYSTAIGTDYRGRPVNLWMALMSDSGSTPTVSYYYLMEEGRIDTLVINEQNDTITLTLTAESRLVDMFTPRRSYLNNVDLQREHPTDVFYEYVPTLPGKRLPWGLKVSSLSSGGTSVSFNDFQSRP